MMHEQARAEAPRNREHEEERLRMRAGRAPLTTAIVHGHDLPHDDWHAAFTRSRIATRPSGWTLEADLWKGEYVVRGLDGACVVLPTLTAACDEVWARERGHTSATHARKALGKSRLPSGASWRFWGLAPREVVHG